MSSSLSHSLSLNLRERSDTNQLQPTSIYICMYISKPSYKSLNICGNNNITTPHTHNLSICCFLMKLFPSIMKHFNRNRPFSYKMFYICVPLLASQRTLLSCQILHPHCSCKHLNAIFIWVSQDTNFALTYFVSHKKISYFLVSLKTLSFIHHCSLFEYSLILSWFVLFVDF